LVFEEFTMAKKRPFYPLEYRQHLIELVRAGRSPDELAKEFDPTPQTIRNWVAQADRDDGVGCGGTTPAERDELRRLKRENKQLRIERDILSKAAAWFARETNAVPKNGSDS
jgi:transposase